MKEDNFSIHNRILGMFPIILFGARVIELTAQGKPAHLLWICHISSVVIALGVFINNVELIRISVLWLILGVPIWPIEIIRTGIMEITSIGTHYFALIFGLLLLKKSGIGKYSWAYGLIWFLLLQQAARLFTPVELNVNLAHSIYPGWEKYFSGYGQYWLFTTLGSGISLWLASKGLSWAYSRNRAPVSEI